ncbi:MAG: 3-deoxy-manno-octulosonate cytidylyltransferase [Gammaproteobacteria bacterium]|nr:3-deoxy-manno-octulosonate cytidylyltransferase [Gammaproteobacteria bacterium]
MDFYVVIPARYESSRFPGKVLADIKGQSMLQRVYNNAIDSGAEKVLIATDDQRVVEVAEKFGAEVLMTSTEHETGTERIFEAVGSMELDSDDIVVGLQADEPLLPADVIKQVAVDLSEHDNVKVATIAEPIASVEELFNPHIVKVVLNRRNYAMYFSRAAIPWEQDSFSKAHDDIQLNGNHFRHIGIYAYRTKFLEEYIELSDCEVDGLEKLEQLRVLWNGNRIHVAINNKKIPPGVDTPEDLERVLKYIKK